MAYYCGECAVWVGSSDVDRYGRRWCAYSRRYEESNQNTYGCRGFVAHHNTDMWGDCAVQDQWVPGSYWVMGAAWLCTHQWTHYLYTKDIEFLKKQIENNKI